MAHVPSAKIGFICRLASDKFFSQKANPGYEFQLLPAQQCKIACLDLVSDDQLKTWFSSLAKKILAMFPQVRMS